MNFANGAGDLLCPEVAGGWAMGVADDGLDTGDQRHYDDAEVDECQLSQR